MYHIVNLRVFKKMNKKIFVIMAKADVIHEGKKGLKFYELKYMRISKDPKIEKKGLPSGNYFSIKEKKKISIARGLDMLDAIVFWDIPPKESIIEVIKDLYDVLDKEYSKLYAVWDEKRHE